MIGRTLDQYRIESRLGEGGMGVVYRAFDPRLSRQVAIKVLPPDKMADPVARQRFVQEATAASALNHPGIVTIHDIRSAAGTDFIVMEYIDGRTLDHVIPPTGLAPDRVLRYGVAIADALAAAHGAGIVHRDLKPSNVMVTGDGRVKILDFGLAKLVAPAERASDRTTVAPLTAERALVGTTAYMSPEQAEGRALDARSDIFSFGVMLYELATGKRPFTGDSHVSVLGKIVNEEPKAPAAHVRSIPPELEKTILRCLRKDPARRFQSTADLKVALEDLQAETARRRHSRGGVARTARWVVSAGLLAAMAAGYAIWSSRSSAVPQQPLRADALTTFPGTELYPSLSPDGNHVVYTWTGPRQDNTDVYVQQIGAGTPLRLTTDPRSDYNPVWSPDGRWIAFLRGNPARPLGRSGREVRLVAPLGGPERKLADVRVQEITVNPAFLTWCPDATCVIVTDGADEGRPDALVVIMLDSGEKRRVTDPQPPVVADINPAVSPDGRSLLFLRHTTWGVGELHLQPLGPGVTAAGPPAHLPAPGVKLDHATWTADGKEILLSTAALAGGAQLWRLPVAGGEPARLAYVGEDGVMPAVSAPQAGRPSRLVYVRSFIDENIWQLQMGAPGQAASAPAVAIASTRSDIHPQFSPDGQRVAFTSTRSGAWEIWIADADGGNAVQLTSMRAPTGTGAPRWSPDGQLIAFASDADGQFDVYVVPAAGGKPRNMTSHPAIEHAPAFSHDGQWLYFSSSRSDGFQLWRVAASGGTPAQVTKHGGWYSQVSPDGQTLYFTASADIGAPLPLWRMPVAGGDPVKVIDGVLNGGFAVLENGIYHVSLTKDITIHYFDFRNRKSVPVASHLGTGSEIGGFAVSADGSRALYVRRDAAIDDLMLVEDFR